MESDPLRAGELLRVMAIEQHMIMLIGKGGHHYRARYFAGVSHLLHGLLTRL